MRKYLLAVIGLMVLLCLLAVLGTAIGSPDTITVDSTTDVLDADADCASVDIGDLPGLDGVTSLREAICAANNNPAYDTIEFNIPITDTGYMVSGITGTWTISLTVALPGLTDDGTTIDGSTQAANIGGDPNPDGPEIETAGADMASADCLTITGANNMIHGLVINRCPEDGIHISGSEATTNTITGNYIGTDATGIQDLGNSNHGLSIESGAQNNVIGPENVISGNDNYGVDIDGIGTDGNTVFGNYIGTDASGAQDRGNSYYGVRIENGAQNNLIGPDNVISGNDYEGVVISDNGTDGNTVSGNYIGTDFSGSSDLGNSREGVLIWGGAQNNVIGGDSPGEGNVISGNDEDGVQISYSGSNGNTISGNYIGTDASGSSPLPNLGHGIEIYDGAQNNVIGGDTPGERNVIAFNGLDGIEISDATSTGNTITQNSIHNNIALGIELRTGANGGILAPAISVATCTSASGTAPISATLELFTGPDDEGKIYLTTVSADGSGYWSASGFFAYGFYLTATATDLNGNTSEFSLALDSGCRHTYLPLIMKNY